MSTLNPYTEALQFIRQYPTTGGAASMAKLVLSLYNEVCGYSFAECIGNLDEQRRVLALRLVTYYAEYGETPELRTVGEALKNDLYPRLWEMGQAMGYAREAKRREWERKEEEAHAAKVRAAEEAFLAGERIQVPLDVALEMIGKPDEGKFYAEYFDGSWYDVKLAENVVREAIRARGASLSDICPDMSSPLTLQVDGRLHYIGTDFEVRERYLESLKA